VNITLTPSYDEGSFLVINYYPDNRLHKKDNNKYRQLKILQWTVGKGGKTKQLSCKHQAEQNRKKYF
jgi:hypothetical protein